MYIYSENYASRISWGPAFCVFGIEGCSVYTGSINKDFLHGDFIHIE